VIAEGAYPDRARLAAAIGIALDDADAPARVDEPR
jgi:hypothetical protein